MKTVSIILDLCSNSKTSNKAKIIASKYLSVEKGAKKYARNQVRRNFHFSFSSGGPSIYKGGWTRSKCWSDAESNFDQNVSKCFVDVHPNKDCFSHLDTNFQIILIKTSAERSVFVTWSRTTKGLKLKKPILIKTYQSVLLKCIQTKTVFRTWTPILGSFW